MLVDSLAVEKAGCSVDLWVAMKVDGMDVMLVEQWVV